MRYSHVRYAKSLFTNIQKQNMLKVSLLLKNLQTSWANNSRIRRIKTALFRRHCFIWTQADREILKSALAYLWYRSALKLHQEYYSWAQYCRFENLPICLYSYKNNTLKIFSFLILRILKLFTRAVCKFLKKWANF